MKKINIAVVVIWFALFALSLNTVDPNGYYGPLSARLIQSATYTAVDTASVICGQECVGSYEIVFGSSEMLRAVMRNTFSGILFVLAVANFFFYYGNGKLGLWLRKPPTAVRAYIGKKMFQRRQRKAGITPRDNSKILFRTQEAND